MDPFGYTHLEFYINGGASSGQNPTIAGKKLSERGITLQANTWTRVSIPLSEVPLSETGRLTRIVIGGTVKETFYLDDVKLLAQKTKQFPTGVEALEGKALPSGYALFQNHPNPFNAQTTIRYALPEGNTVRLCVYDVTGQRIRTLVEGYHSAGAYRVGWDGTDEEGRTVASGVVLVRMEAGDYGAVRKMVVVR